MTSPSLMIIGTQKAGTTTLFDFLNAQEGFVGSRKKETGFFINDCLYNRRSDYYCKTYWDKTPENTIAFEATPDYLYYGYTAKRIFDFNPAMKFLVVLRDPASRCYSAWNMFRTFHRNNPEAIFKEFIEDCNTEIREELHKLLFSPEFPSYEEAVYDDIMRDRDGSKLMEPSFFRRGLYVNQIKKYLEYFDISQFLFLEQDELNKPLELAEKLSSFLLKDIQFLDKVVPHSNRGIYHDTDTISHKTTKLLQSLYADTDKELIKITGRGFSWIPSYDQETEQYSAPQNKESILLEIARQCIVRQRQTLLATRIENQDIIAEKIQLEQVITDLNKTISQQNHQLGSVTHLIKTRLLKLQNFLYRKSVSRVLHFYSSVKRK